MQKGERTKELIRQRVAPVFNTHGFAGTTIADLTEATGLEKGGIYNHFPNKQALALAAFDYTAEEQRKLFVAAVASSVRPAEQLLALVAVLRQMFATPPVAGGCPVMNTAIEADDAYPILRQKAQDAMHKLLALIGNIVKAGIANGDFRPEIQPRQVATVLVALIEGGLMLSKLYHDPVYVERVIEQGRELIAGWSQKGENPNE